MDRAALFRVGSHSGLTVRHAAWDAAWDAAWNCLAAITYESPRTLALLGPAGVGKSLMLRELTQALAGTDPVLLRGGQDQIPADFGSTTVVLIDDADDLEEEALKSLVRQGPGRLVLAGSASLGDRLKDLSTHVMIVSLVPLVRTEVAGFLAGLFTGAGESADLLSKQAIERIALYALGVPRTLSAIARTACMLACSEGATRVEGPHVDVAFAVLEEGGKDGGKAPLRLPNPAVYALFSAAQSGNDPDRGSELELGQPLMAAEEPDHETAERSPPSARRPDAPPTAFAVKRLSLMLAAGSLAAGVGLLAVFWTEAGAGYLPFLGAKTSIPVQAALADGTPSVSAPAEATTSAATEADTPRPAAENASGVPQPRQNTATQATVQETAQGTAPGNAQETAQSADQPDPSEGQPQGQTRMATGATPPDRSVSVVAASLDPNADTGRDAHPATPVMPAMGPLRVMMTYPRGDAGAAQQAARTAATLRAAAIATVDPVPVSPSSARPGIGYFYLQDRPSASAVERIVGGQFGGSGLVARPRQERPPAPGTIEVYVPGRDRMTAIAKAGRQSANVADR